MNIAQIPITIQLNSYQQNIVNNFTQQAQENTISTAYEYWKDTEDAAIKIFCNQQDQAIHASSNLLIAGLGAMTGPFIGIMAIPNRNISPGDNCLSDNKLSAIISVASAVISCAVFQTKIITENINNIKNSLEFAQWKEKRQKILQDNIINDFLKKDDYLQHLICPLTNKIPKNPCCFKNIPLTFEFKKAVKYIEDNPNKPLPGLQKIISQNELCFDYKHINSKILRLKNIRFHLCKEKNRIEEDITKCALYRLGIHHSRQDQNAQKLWLIANLCETFPWAKEHKAFNLINMIRYKRFSSIPRFQGYYQLEKSLYHCFNKAVNMLDLAHAEAIIINPEIENPESEIHNNYIKKNSYVIRISVSQNKGFDKAYSQFRNLPKKVTFSEQPWVYKDKNSSVIPILKSTNPSRYIDNAVSWANIANPLS
jgi:hypothetical protein